MTVSQDHQERPRPRAIARRYHLRPLPSSGRIRLPKELAHHVGRVARARPGDPIQFFDGEGAECRGVVVGVRHGEVLVEIGTDQATAAQPEPRVQLELAFHPPKGGRADWLLEHGTEVGVTFFTPLVSQRSNATLAQIEARRARWERILTAATGQCDRAWTPLLRPALRLEDWLGSEDLPADRVVAQAGGRMVGDANGDAVALLVGPEGGLTEAELQSAVQRGFRPRALGPLTMRVETAGLIGAARLIAGSDTRADPQN